MNKNEMVDFLLDELISERSENIDVPDNYNDKRLLLRSLMNIRLPGPVSDKFLNIQDELLTIETNEKNLMGVDDLKAISDDSRIVIYHGDITCLKVDAIVNAANSKLLGCFVPLHNCIDNVIHSAAGIQLRYDCNRIMIQQGHDEEAGQAKITKAYNLPCKYVIHTVGPALQKGFKPSHEDEKLLKSSYINSLKLADIYNLESIAFPNISTGVFNYPKPDAAKAAVDTVEEFLENSPDTSIKYVIFDTFEDEQFEIYKKLLIS